MKKTFAVMVLLFGAVAVTGCDDSSRFNEHKAELNQISSECIAAGGSFTVENVWYFEYTCTMPGAPVVVDN